MGQRIRCKKCGDIIMSRHRHDFVRCRCGSIAVDGGNDYTRVCGKTENYELVETTDRRDYWEMTAQQKEAMLAEPVEREIARHHAAGRPTCHGDDKGVFWLYPDGSKEYFKLYSGGAKSAHGHLRAEEISIRLYQAIVGKIRNDPATHIATAKKFLARLRQDHPGPGGAASYLDRWERLMDGPLEDLLAFMTSPSQEARDMRQAAPFAGILTIEERWQVFCDFYRDEGKVPPVELHEQLVSMYLYGNESDIEYCAGLVSTGVVDREYLVEKLYEADCSAEQKEKARAVIEKHFSLREYQEEGD